MPESLKESPLNLQAFLEHVQDVIFRWSAEGFEFISPAVDRLTGHKPMSFYRNRVSWKDIVFPDDLPRLKTALEDTLAGETISQPVAARWIRADGSLVWVELLLSAVRDGQGQIVAVDGVARIDHARLVERERRQREISDTLLKISAVLASSLHLDQTLAHILEQLEGLIPFDSATIYLVSTRSKKLRMVTARGIPDVNVTMESSREVDRFPLDEAVLSTARPVIVPDVRHDPRWRALKGTEYIRSYMGVPLLVRGLPIGLVTVDRRIPDSFIESDAQLAVAFAQHAAVAIENARLFSEVTAQQRRLHKLLSKVVTAQEEERRRISRELHDEMGQALTAIKLNLQMVLATLPGDAGALRERLEEIVELSGDALQEVRRLAMDLRPSMLDDLGLIPTLRWYIESFQKRTGVKMEMMLPEELGRLSPVVETTLYRVVQEALTNVSRHAGASQVTINLAKDERALIMSIADDGKGFELRELTNHDVSGVGITSMQERIDEMGGTFVIDSQPGCGTRIDVSIPAVVLFQLT